MNTIHNLGLPRIGAHRELKQALEKYWKKDISLNDLLEQGRALRNRHWQLQHEQGATWVTVGDFAWYDHVLEWSCTIGAVPRRFKDLQVQAQSQSADGNQLNLLFAIARGYQNESTTLAAAEMTKWFDTNYHYIVPELALNQQFTISRQSLFEQVKEAQALGFEAKVVLPGPLTYLALSKGKDFEGSLDNKKLALLPNLLKVYEEALLKLAELHVQWVQLDEPFVLLDLNDEWQKAYRQTYERLSEQTVKILVATYFEGAQANQQLIQDLNVSGVHLDLTRGQLDLPVFLNNYSKDKVLSLGVIDGRNIWRSDIEKVVHKIEPALNALGDKVWLAPSCSLLHIPYDVNLETKLNPEIKGVLAFTVQKLEELRLLGNYIDQAFAAIGLVDVETALKKLSVADQAAWLEQKRVLLARQQSTLIHNDKVTARVAQIEEISLKRTPYVKRIGKQRENLHLPPLPTTTIGSFPQTPEIRRLRSTWKKGEMSDQTYENSIKEEIAYVIKVQEELGLDVLVHGEPERNDMVEYFGALLGGYAFTEHGWVQSYGSRCVKPPIIYGDVTRLIKMTTEWTSYAQSLTDKPVKGMLTGPVTMLQWSFVRDDQPRSVTCKQLALALRDEIADLENVGIKVIQIDEPALREGLPLRKEDWQHYLQWAVDAFLLSTSGVKEETQVHTHMCYSEFNDIIEAIAAMDADVITIETSRSNMELLQVFEDFEYPNEIGPGVYDIHSPNVPSKEWMVDLIEKAAKRIPYDRLWINPDCGLKTRAWPETKAALAVMVAAAKELRQELS